MAEPGSDDTEKTEDPTPRRLEQAREEGQIARSRELTTFLLLIAAVIMFWVTGATLGERISSIFEFGLSFDRKSAFDPIVTLTRTWEMGMETLYSLAPVFVVLVVVAIIGPIALGGWLFAPKSLQPKLDKLNPIKGLKRIFSSQSLVELLKAIAKSLLIGLVMVYFIYAHIGEMLGLISESVNSALAHSMQLILLCCLLAVGSFIVVVAIDVPFQVWNHTRQLRMSKEEIKRELKETEGDPQIKARVRQLQQEASRKRMMAAVPDADVVVTNPTHYSVALKYDELNMSAPVICALGADQVAFRIRTLAEENAVPILEAPPLARALYHHGDLDKEIPIDLYTAVAEVLAWVFQLKEAQKNLGAYPDTPEHLPVPAELDVNGGG